MKIAYGKSRFEKEWRNSEISWEYFCRKVSTTYRTTETVEEFSKMTKAQQGEIKETEIRKRIAKVDADA